MSSTVAEIAPKIDIFFLIILIILINIHYSLTNSFVNTSDTPDNAIRDCSKNRQSLSHISFYLIFVHSHHWQQNLYNILNTPDNIIHSGRDCSKNRQHHPHISIYLIFVHSHHCQHNFYNFSDTPNDNVID